MFIRDVRASLLRRWYLVLLALVASLGLCQLAAQWVPVSYISQASIVMVPPDSTVNPPGQPGEETTRGNPYLYLGGLEQAVGVVVRSVDSEQTHGAVALVAAGKFEVTPDYTTSAPLLVVKAEASTSAGTQKLLDAVLAQVPDNLNALQAQLQIPASSRITTFVVSTTEVPVPNRKILVRSVALAGIASMALFALLIAALDGLLERRGRPSPGDPDLAVDEPSGSGPEPNDLPATAARVVEDTQVTVVPDPPARIPLKVRKLWSVRPAGSVSQSIEDPDVAASTGP